MENIYVLYTVRNRAKRAIVRQNKNILKHFLL